MKNFVDANPSCPWSMQGALATIETSASAPTLFFHNSDDYYKDNNKNPQGLYATQASLMKEKLDAVGTPTEILSGYSSGHAVPQTTETLQVMYDFLTTHIPVSPDTRIDRAIVNHAQPSIPDATYNLMGSRVGPSYKRLVIRSGRQVVVR